MTYTKQDPTGAQSAEPLPRPPEPPKPAAGNAGWGGRVRFSEEAGGYAFRPDQMVVMGLPSMIEQAGELLGELGIESQVERIGPTSWRFTGSFDVESTVAELRSIGLRADPNYVMFIHSCCCHACGGYGFAANPLNANPLNANPLNANPLNANPLNANPLNANPLNANPLNANPLNANPLNANFRATGIRPSSALPSQPPDRGPLPKLPTKPHKAIVIDTGIAGSRDTPALLVGTALELTEPADYDSTDIEPTDGHLDSASGHGTFISGVIEQLAPGRVVRSARAITTVGDVDTVLASQHLQYLVDNGDIDKFTIVNLSFGGYADSNMPVLAAAIRQVQAKGGVVVASAGNDGRCEPQVPAALPDVVSVGSIEPGGRAAYSNYGCWVRACAPGTSVVSSFFKDFDGAVEAIATGAPGDPDHYQEWANWTGTSFAAPIVVAALLRHMAVTDTDAKTAVKQIIDDPRLFRYPGLGTVVNIVP